MDLKELVRRYVQQRTVLLVDNRHFEAGKEFAVLRRQPSSEAITSTVDALDFALKLINEKDAEIERLKSQAEQVDTVVAGVPTIKPESCCHDWVIPEKLPNKLAAATEAFCKKCGIGKKENAMKYLAMMQGDADVGVQS